MPNKIDIEQVKTLLPSFVVIVPETYQGIRYKASFVDTEYNEPFTAIVGSVVKLQHGCRSRSNKLRSQAKGNMGHMTPVAAILAALPLYLELDLASYKGKRHKARFYDKENNVSFESLVCNVLRNGARGCCKARKEKNFKQKINRTANDIQKELDLKYPNQFKLIPESYLDTNSMAKFIDIKTDKIFIAGVQTILNGRHFEKEKQREWNKSVKERDGFTCQVCSNKTKLCVHHLYAWTAFPALRFEVQNGITLCNKCHREFHSKYGNGNNTLDQFTTHIKEKGEHLAVFALKLNQRVTF